MSYQVLARKWRPRVFGELVGQESVVRALSNALDKGRLHHAYLFTGTRGVGKTTLARILAKSLNCEAFDGPTSMPCGQCSTCRSVDEGRFVDLIEVDAASRSKVDETRDLLDNVPFAPVAGRYKVYLIDEVHMFSGHSFNALLKTLEEPPPHVKFILATTDPQKLPITILSRCLQFNLRQLPYEVIQAHLHHLLGQEAVESEAMALTLLSRAAAGSMRDALSLLDQAIAYGAGRVLEADVRAMLGILPEERYARVLKALAAADAVALLDAIAELAAFAPDFAAALRALLGLLHRIALAQTLPAAIADADSDAEQVRELAALMSPETVQLYYQIGLLGQRDLPFAPDPRSGFEMVLLRMLAFRPEGMAAGGAGPTNATGSKARPETVAQAQATPPQQPMRTISHTKPAQHVNAVPPAQGADAILPQGVRPQTQQQGAPEGGQGQRTDDWHEVTAAIAPALGGMATQLAENCTIKGWQGDTLILNLATGAQRLSSDKARERLHKSLQSYYGAEIDIRFEQLDAQEPSVQSPAARKAEQQRQRQQDAEVAMAQNPYIKALVQGFGAELIPESIRPADMSLH